MRLMRGIIAATVIGALLPIGARALTYDVMIRPSDITFQPMKFFMGDRVRVYATVRNIGDNDVQGNVFFSENGTAVGTPPPLSVKAKGAEEEVWVDWQPAVLGDRQIFVRIVAAPETGDQNPANNEMIIPVVIDQDTDHDGIGDRDDLDDDNDGLPDAWEEAHGLNPRDPSDALRDPDGDGRSTIDEYRAGTDPFKAEASGVSYQPVSTSVSGGSSSSTGALPGSAAPAGTSPSAATKTTTGPSRAPATPPAGRPSVIAPVPPKTVIVPAPVDVPAPTPPPPPAPSAPYDTQLRQLLGTRASPWRSAVPIAAGIVALGGIVALAFLFIRRRSNEKSDHEPSPPPVDRRPRRPS
ncbi:MAG: hypothetical protein Q7S02_01515 [bacterium]|nr:hypothetical protein [bacterium]